MSLALSVVLILLSVLFLNNEKVVEAADNLVLLENRNPGYWNYLNPEMGTVVNVPPEGAKNLLIIDPEDQEQNGVTFTVNEDHTITLNGTNTGEGFNFSLGKLSMPDGNYIMTDGAPVPGVNMYVWCNQLEETAAFGSNEKFEVVNKSTSYHCGIRIDSGVALDDVVIYPMIRNSGDDSYEPYFEPNQCATALIYKAENGVVTNEDVKILERNIKNFKCSWTSIIYQDGTGIQVKDGIKSARKLDTYGRLELS